ncbi:MAG: hypothetical protein IAE67_07700 [Candidatus Competibacteraceae bacterium]|nr:hypothetical protein [Candidatus Competibacteraceae bacterium]
MGCVSCTTRGGRCGTESSGASSGCNKLEVFEWLAQIRQPVMQAEWVEIRFKNTRKEFYFNESMLSLQVGDIVAVEGSPGHDIGIVSLTGEMVKLQLRRLRLNPQVMEKKVVYRVARENDIKRWQDAIAKEMDFMRFCRKTARNLRLEMKVSDVECQGDGSKATFFYTADGRVDFRELIKILARDLKVRIEMRQIGYRQEAGRLGGIGVCGRDLCCSTWLRDFRSVSTAAARYQQLSINPQKLAGQCGKLKCCLNYELDTYMEALREFPKQHLKLKTKSGEASLQKTDIFRKILYYAYDTSPEVFIPLSLNVVKDIIQDNKNGIFPDDLAGFLEEKPKPEKQASYSNVIEEDSLTRFDNKNKKRKKKKRKPNRQPNA